MERSGERVTVCSAAISCLGEQLPPRAEMFGAGSVILFMRAMMALVLHLGGVGNCVRLIWEWSVHNQESGDLHREGCHNQSEVRLQGDLRPSAVYRDHREDGICSPGGYKCKPEEDAAEEEALSYSATSSHDAGRSKKGWWAKHHLLDWFTAFMPLTPDANLEYPAIANVKGTGRPSLPCQIGQCTPTRRRC